jgi:hypothetical protein
MNTSTVDTMTAELRKVKKLAEKAIDQLNDEQLWIRLDPEANSVAVLMRHLAGNMRSRWTNFRTSDGEKPDRQRDQEFEDIALSRAELIAEWEDGWQRVFGALEPLTDADLQDTVYVREEPHSIVQAIVRQIVHYSGHAYQILFVAKHLKGDGWHTPSIARGKSEQYNRQLMNRKREER